MPFVADPPPKLMQCMEVWGGNQLIDRGVIMPGLDAWIFSRPCENDEAGGDVHYVSSCAAGWFTRMLVADVSGHGLAVSQVASDLRALMRRHVNDHDQARFVRSLNAEFTASSQANIFATAVAVTFDAVNNQILVCNAGHPPPLRYSAKAGNWSLLTAETAADDSAGNVPLGIVDVPYGQFKVRLGVGDVVVVYTDGFIEALNPDGSFLGIEGLLSLVTSLNAVPADLPSLLMNALRALDPSNLDRDDLTLLLFRPNGLRPRIPLIDRVLAPIRLIAGYANMHFNWSGAARPTR